MNDYDKAWKKLAAAARLAPGAEDESAPYGFSTRVVAVAFAAGRAAPSVFARMSLRAAVVACLLAAVAVGVNYSAIAGLLDDDPAAAPTVSTASAAATPAASAVPSGDDPVAEVVNAGS